MDKNTFANDGIAKYLNEYYYPVKFDAEYRNDIEFNGKVYKFIKTYKGGYHELATYILSGKLSFPSMVFLDENLMVIQSIPGYQNAKSLDMILHYFGENHHKATPWRRYEKTYVPEHSQSRKIAFPVKSGH
jgi:thioredoxin-related protein